MWSDKATNNPPIPSPAFLQTPPTPPGSARSQGKLAKNATSTLLTLLWIQVSLDCLWEGVCQCSVGGKWRAGCGEGGEDARPRAGWWTDYGGEAALDRCLPSTISWPAGEPGTEGKKHLTPSQGTKKKSFKRDFSSSSCVYQEESARK